MQYKRFVSYVFQYENGKKGENVGFVRMEFQGEKIILNVHFRIRVCVNEWLQLYLFRNRNDRLEGMPVGKGRMKWNTFDMQTVITKDKMEDYGCDIAELKGLYIQSESGKVFASSWEDGELYVGEFFPIASQEQNLTKRKEELHEIFNESFEVTKSEEEVRETDWETEDIEANKVEVAIEETNIEEEALEEMSYEEAETVEAMDLEVVDVEAADEVQIDIDVEEISATEEKKLESEEMDFEKIDLHFLEKLAKKDWGLSNNRFLLHGYYNYHYLCFRKKNAATAEIGVPGIYHPLEKAVAAMYGFDSFCPKDGSSEILTNGRFGYWCKTVALATRE